MKKNVLTIAALLFVLLLTEACQDTKEQSLDKVKALETSVFNPNASVQEPAQWQNLMEEYVRFADQYPEDSMAPEMLMRAADVAGNLNQPGYAITLYQRIYDTYSQFPKKPDALFMIAFVYENSVGDWDQAKVYYERFLQEYPEHNFAPSAKIFLENIGVPAEELILKFLENQEE